MNPPEPQEIERELEQNLHAELRRLPPLKAPATLVPRVLSVLEQRTRRPWWQRPWLAWPRPLRIASVVVVVLGLGGLSGWAWPWLHTQGVSTAQHLVGQFPGLAAGMSLALSLVQALVMVLQTYRSALLYVFLALALVYLTCLGLGTLCYRLVFAKR